MEILKEGEKSKAEVLKRASGIRREAKPQNQIGSLIKIELPQSRLN